MDHTQSSSTLIQVCMRLLMCKLRYPTVVYDKFDENHWRRANDATDDSLRLRSSLKAHSHDYCIVM